MLDEQAKAKCAAVLAEYREKLKSGEIIRTKSLNPKRKQRLTLQAWNTLFAQNVGTVPVGRRKKLSYVR